jgi:peroxidase
MKTILQTITSLAIIIVSTIATFAQSNRTLDGSGNNLTHQEWGAVGVNQLIPGTIGFADGISAPGGQDRPNPRYISNMLFIQNTLANDPRDLSAYCWVWGQFIDHDITLVKDNPSEVLTIPVPKGDPFFDPQGNGTATLSMKRSAYDPSTGTDISNPRQFTNHITAYIDGSGVYGSDQNRADWLRTFSGGKLKMSSGNLLPWNTTTGEFDAIVDPNAPEMAMPIPNVYKFFVAGDVRANENPFLTSMHTLFVREHNRLCDELIVNHPTWTDEQLYQHVRKIVGGEIEAIVYEEWLPLLGIELQPYPGYNSNTNAGIMNVFSAAAFRYGHTTINSVLVRMDNEGNYMPEGDILLRDAFFNPDAVQQVGGIEPYLVGMATVIQQDFDCKVIDDLRNFLFGAPGSGGQDLVVLNIARGRERGLADYNTVRTDFGLQPLTNFSEISSDPLMNQNLSFIYLDINNIDPWAGLLAENHMPDALFGKTAMTIIRQQFLAIRDGDRYYYINDPDLSVSEKLNIHGTTLSDIIRRNSPVTIINDEIFKVQSFATASKDLSATDIDFSLYPNPVNQMVFLRIYSETHRDGVIQITDIQGKLVMQREVQLSSGNNTLTLTLPTDCVAGLYVLMIRSENQIGQKMFFKKE